MAKFQNLRTISLTLDTISWTALNPTFRYESFYVLNPGGNPDVKRRTDPNDPLTEVTLGGSQMENFIPGNTDSSGFPASTPQLYYQAASGAPSIKAVFCV